MHTQTQTPTSTAKVIYPNGEVAYFEDTRVAVIYVAGYTNGELGVFIDAFHGEFGMVAVFQIGQ